MQAVMAELMAEHLGGDTLLTVVVFLLLSQSTKRHSHVAKAALEWRWLIIDDISMIRFQLLAGIDICFRIWACQVRILHHVCETDMENCV